MMTMIVIVVSTHNINDDVDNDCDLGWDIQMTSSGAVVPYINNAVCLQCYDSIHLKSFEHMALPIQFTSIFGRKINSY